MADITQAATGNEVTFSADSPKAENWMQREYGSHTVVFKFPNEAQNAKRFRERAEQEGFTIVNL